MGGRRVRGIPLKRKTPAHVQRIGERGMRQPGTAWLAMGQEQTTWVRDGMTAGGRRRPK